jgi:hypothetical protein
MPAAGPAYERGIDMGIDRIGGRPPGLPAPEGAGPSRPTGADAPFQASRPREAAEAEAVQTPSPALERLRTGQIDLGQYLDQKIDEATSHLSALPAAQLDSIRAALRDRLAADPSLVDLVRAAAGPTPPSRDG